MKSENISVIFGFELQTDQGNKRLKREALLLWRTPVAKEKTFLRKMFRSSDDRLLVETEFWSNGCFFMRFWASKIDCNSDYGVVEVIFTLSNLF